MTVKALIKLLSALPKSHKVVVWDSQHGYMDIEKCALRKKEEIVELI